MFAIEYRPKSFKDVVGHEVVKKVLSAVIKAPATAPKTYIMTGEWGTGKTTLARIFGKHINCLSTTKPCYKCANCTDDSLYYELDSSVIGNVKDTKVLQETLYYSIGKGYRVVVFDEIQVASRAAQSSFLKVLENPPDKTFFLLLTTNPEDVLKTIISRSMELNFYLLTDTQIASVIDSVLSKVNKTVTQSVKNVIVRRANGHARDAVILLEMALMVGTEDFIKTVKINDALFEILFERILDKKDPTRIIDELIASPISYLKVDFERFILKLFSQIFGDEGALFDGRLNEKLAMRLLSYYTRFKPLLSNSSSEFYSVLLGLKTILTTQEKSSKNLLKDRFSK